MANIACPNCNRSLQVPDAYQGRKFRCPACQNVFEAGTGITAQAPRPPVLMPSDSEIRSGRPPAGGPPPLPSRQRPGDIYDDDEDDRPRRKRKRSTYRPAGGLGLAVRILLGLNLLIGLAMLGSDCAQYSLAVR